MNALDRGFVSSGFSHCPLLNLSCDWFNYMECVGNKGMEVRIFLYLLKNGDDFLPVTAKRSLKNILL